MNILDLIQGSPEWHAHRAKHFNASDAPAMKGVSKYTTRTELLRRMATGIEKEVNPATQRRFDDGHASEAAARHIVEARIGESLFPATGSETIEGLPLSASFDGITMSEDDCWENKLWNSALADQIRAEQLEPHYYWQLEQQLLVADAKRVYFTTSDSTADGTIGMWYESQPERRAALIAGWKQFAEDLANYQHAEAKPEPTAATIEALPALLVQVEGRVLATNLDAFKASAQTFIDNIKTELVNDQDFADADKMVKFLKDGEDRLAQAKQHALAQTASIDELFRTVDAISEQMRSKRLALDKLVKAEKVNRKAAIISEARQALDAHVAKLNERIGGRWMPPFNDGRFAEATAGLKSLDSMRDKVSTALANAKIEANEIADRIEANRKMLVVDGRDWIDLFPDFAGVCTGGTDLFRLVVKDRIDRHNERIEAEREKIRQEEAAKLTAQNQTQYEDQRGKANAGITTPACEQTTAAPDAGIMPVELPAGNAASAASTPPTQTFTSERVGEVVNESMIDDYIRLLGISAAEKKALRGHLVKFESYRIKMAAARGLAAAA